MLLVECEQISYLLLTVLKNFHVLSTWTDTVVLNILLVAHIVFSEAKLKENRNFRENVTGKYGAFLTKTYEWEISSTSEKEKFQLISIF